MYIRNGSTTITLHDNIGLVSWIQIWRPFSFDHYVSSTWYIITCTVCPGLGSSVVERSV